MPSFTPNDPLYANQWHLGLLGDIETIWADYTGSGVAVGVYDDGVQASHWDLDGNYDASLHVSVGGQTLTGEDPGAPMQHGTAVAGLIGAENNGQGGVGVAFGSSLTGVPIFSGAAGTLQGLIAAVDQSENFDVINHSWGLIVGNSYTQIHFDPDIAAEYAAIVGEWYEAAQQGRDGLGTVQVKAAGNDFSNANGDTLQATQVTITVGAYDDMGDAAFYSNDGANLLISAPSNGGMAGQVTTDVTGAGGYAPGGYGDSFGGTSGAAPIVTGVIALMLEANPNLGWRDVQTILAYSATEVGSGVGGAQTSDEDHDWFYNGADNWNGGGLHFSEDYGYGAVDAFNAVRMAEAWDLFGDAQTSANWHSYTLETVAPVALADAVGGTDGVTDVTFTFEPPAFEVEFVQVTLDITHAFLSDLVVQLISASGTVVELMGREFGTDDLGDFGWTWNFGANAFRGEDAAGTWTLRFIDEYAMDAGTLNGATVRLQGRDSTQGQDLDKDVYHFTDEYSDVVGGGEHDRLIDDTDGSLNDWANAAAVATGSVFDLTGRLNGSRIDGVQTTLRGIENAVGGDGNDVFFASAAANELVGMRGVDTVSYLRATSGVRADLLRSGANTGFAAGDMYTSIENLRGSNHADVLLGGHGRNVIVAGNGNDFVRARNGDDFVLGEGGNDKLYGENGADKLDGGAGNDRLYGGLGNDELIGGVGADNLYGQDSNDLLDGGDGNDTLRGGSGADRMLGGAGDDLMQGGTGADRLFGGDGDDRIFGDADADLLRGGDGADRLLGGDGNDQLFGDAGNDIVLGDGGNDRLDGGAGDDLLTGGSGNDILRGGVGNDRLFGDAGNDTLYGDAGNDRLVGGLGGDRLFGGAGADAFVYVDVADSTLAAAGRDRIVDFAAGLDTIDLRGIDADITTAGDQAFTFVGRAGFSGTAGELRFNGALLTGDVDGDGVADFAIAIDGAPALAASDFVL